MSDDLIRVRGARLHNLQDVDVDLPRGRLVAFTGVSGSGKSSLAFGTIHGEAQRRYLDTVAPFARRLLRLAADPQVRAIEGLPPAVALEQRAPSTTSRSSVATVTATGSTLRMLYSRCGDYPDGAHRLDSDHFSANTVAGACGGCGGTGVVHEPTEQSMVPDPSLSIAEGAIAAYPGAWQGKNYRDILRTLGYDVERPWRDLPAAEREWILFTDDEPVVTVHAEREAGRIQRPYEGTFASPRRYLLKTLAQTQSASLRAKALAHVQTRPCPVCGGRRLAPEALAVTWRGRAIDETLALPVAELLAVVRDRRAALEDAGRGRSDAREAAETDLLADLDARLTSVTDLGLGHLQLGRATSAVSSGELQRLRLAALLRSGLFGVVYVLDEPTAGLHPRDLEPLLALLRSLVDAGNSVLLVEHDTSAVLAADWVVDIGPGAGRDGGRLVYSGPTPGLMAQPDSVTARYLPRPVHPEQVRSGGPRAPRGSLRVSGIRRHTLDDLTVCLPLGCVTAVTGVSGSGKSSLLAALHDAMTAHLASHSGGSPVNLDASDTDEPAVPDVDAPDVGPVAQVTTDGDGAPHRLVRITQKPIGRTPRSTLATYTGLFDRVRTLFAATPLARERRYTAGRFSFNVASGRCPTCQGEGAVSVELLFLPGASAPCPDCHGARYAPDTLDVTWQGATIADVLDLTVTDALALFAEQAPIRRSLEALSYLGLGYLTLGQPAPTLSGGEAQRIKLAAELATQRRAPTLYVLDEPTAGLHPADVHLLLARLHALADAGHTVVVAEHHRAAVATADHEIELGPGAGPDGGRIVRAGPPRTP